MAFKEPKISQEIFEDADIFSENRELANHFMLLSALYYSLVDEDKIKTYNIVSKVIERAKGAILCGEDYLEALRSIVRENRLKLNSDSITSEIDEFLTNLDANVHSTKLLEQLSTEVCGDIGFLRKLTEIFSIGPSVAYKAVFLNYAKDLKEFLFIATLDDYQRKCIKWRLHISQPISVNEMNLIKDRIHKLFNNNPNFIYELVGPYRRGEECQRIDLLVGKLKSTANDLDEVKAILKPNLLDELVTRVYSGRFLGIFRLDDNFPAHLIYVRCFPYQWYYPYLLYSTGSRRFNILMRRRAKDLGMTLSEYQLLDSNKKALQLDSEEEIFKNLRVNYLKPEKRTKDLNALETY